MRRPHVVPLSTHVIELFKQLKPITGHYPYIFIGRNNRSKPISKESVLQVIELLGYKGCATGHGFRHTMSTILHEQGFDSTWIEMQLAHIDKNRIRGTYNHALYLKDRRMMLEWYANKILTIVEEN
ncbi:Prophage integrase IntS [Klebsiella oxytoca]|nr:Prophage integrase IntS [Klebsiella oxytoca]CAF2844631.1 Prophage integrase IntS [Klebsiella oxytoca]CAH5360690.1 Prophage integrase IntS [Klebsiella oxytoca]CAH5452658.1 Prophage integrase IntS [Klebsiella oxytoca]SQI79194.1 phage integrase, Phage P4-associated [Klebsiella oxytoca]